MVTAHRNETLNKHQRQKFKEALFNAGYAMLVNTRVPALGAMAIEWHMQSSVCSVCRYGGTKFSSDELKRLCENTRITADSVHVDLFPQVQALACKWQTQKHQNRRGIWGRGADSGDTCGMV